MNKDKQLTISELVRRLANLFHYLGEWQKKEYIESPVLPRTVHEWSEIDAYLEACKQVQKHNADIDESIAVYREETQAVKNELAKELKYLQKTWIKIEFIRDKKGEHRWVHVDLTGYGMKEYFNGVTVYTQEQAEEYFIDMGYPVEELRK